MEKQEKYPEIAYKGWRVVRKINSGSFGKVYEIEKEDLGHWYQSALKVIEIQGESVDLTWKKGADHDRSLNTYMESMADKILEEIDLMNQLKGITNIVSYEDHELRKTEDGRGWQIMLRMELLKPLENCMDSMKREDIIRLGIDICRALERCHKEKIIHRDIKPGNIFISDQGDFKLGDFGIAKIMDLGELDDVTSNQGTLNYMAPEVRNGKSYSFNVDLYSLGLVMYRLLNKNCLPFCENAETVQAQEKARAKRFRGDAIPFPCEDDTQLAKVVLKACSYNPKERYQTAEEMRRDLEKVLREEPVLKAPKFKKIALIPAALLLAVILIVVFSKWKPDPVPPDPGPKQDPIIILIEQGNFSSAYSRLKKRTESGENMDEIIYIFVRACEKESEYKRAGAAMKMLSDQINANADFYKETVKWMYEHREEEIGRYILTELRSRGDEGEALANKIGAEYDDNNKKGNNKKTNN